MIVNGTTYRDETPEAVVKVLEDSRVNGHRIRIRYGDTETGCAWGDSLEIGTVGRSTGSEKIPILLKNSRSTGGCAILDDCIVLIEWSTKERRTWLGTLYRHPNFHFKGERWSTPSELVEAIQRGA